MTAPARRTLFQDLTQVLKSGLFKTGLGAGAVRIAGLALMLAVSVVLARVLGANGLGQYALAISVINLLGLPALMGLPSLVTRETARALAVQDWPMMRGLWFWATGRILALSCVVIALCLLVLLLLPALIEDNARQVLLWGLPLVPLLALSAARSAALSGLGRVVWAQMPDNLFRPFVMIVLLSGAFILGGSDISAQLAMRLQVGAAAAAFAIGLVLFLKARPTEVTENTTRTQQTRDWNAAIWSIALIASAQSLMANADLLMLGWWRSAPEVGYYKVASTGASLCAIGMGIVASVINPRFAALHKTAETGKLARIASWGAAAGFAMALPMALVFFLWAGPVLRLVYGEPFVPGATALIILTAAQVVSTFFGSCIGLLNMTGHEKHTMRAFVLATVVNIGLNAALIPQFGASGAAWATFCAVVLWNVMLWLAGLKLLRIDSSVLGLVRKGTA